MHPTEYALEALRRNTHGHSVGARQGGMELSLLKRRKLPLLFLLGVGVPSLALSVLALRGIQNELAVAEQRRLDTYRALSRRIGDTLTAEMVRVETDLSRLTVGREITRSPELLREFDRFRSTRPFVEAVFFIEPSGGVRIASGDLLFRRAENLAGPEASPWPAAAAAAMRAGQREEFQNNRYQAALSSYRTAFRAASDPALRGEAVIAMIRVQRKAGRWRNALSDCETLLHDYGGTRTSGGTLLGPTARMERSSLLLATGDSVGAVASLADLYARLVDGEWEMGRGEYEFLSGRTTSAIAELTPRPSGAPADSLSRVLASLRSKEDDRRRSTERLLLLDEILERQPSTVVAGDSGFGDTGVRRLALEGGGETFLVSLVGVSGRPPGTDADGRARAREGRWGILFDEGHAAQSLVRTALAAELDPSATGWVVRDRNGRALFAGPGPAAGVPSLTATVAGGFPPWLLEFHARPQDPWRLLLASGQSLYLYMFLAIATILVFGVVVTVRAITRELELARLKSDFVSTVSHEFKSPLTSILQLSEMLQTGRVVSEERRQWYYDVLVEQGARLSALVNNVLDLARIDEGRKEFRSECVDVGSLVREVVATARHRVGPEGFEVACQVEEPLPPVRGDAEAFRQAISNLLDNAVRYSGDARRVDVRVGGGEGIVTVEVEDRGVGIPRDEVDRVFDRFHRGSSELIRSVRGSGLGLTLVKEIVDAHGGTVDVTSEVGEGSIFRITLPATGEVSRD